MQAVILAGGKGRRLRPYTLVLPKPLMPIGDMPILEVVIRQLKKYGFQKITITVDYLAELLEAYFRDGSKWNVEIAYSKDYEPLGTAGPIASIKDLEHNFIVMNGDILTTLDYSKLMGYHIKENSMITIAVYDKNVNIDLGILKLNENDEIYDYIEKPTLKYQVSTGIYVFNKKVLKYIKKNEYLDFPDLIKILIKNNERVKGFHFSGYWLDIGRREDHEKAIEEFEELKHRFLG
ncbi:MAG: sugar phosphate nucleotidyltransferase [Candidatus Aminicenantes bacterium]|nr:sugar phosphate nucleotidyltransferase [Candidatus Aminicenantes bacterium]